MSADIPEVILDEKIVLSKFDGEALPENEVERVHVHNGIIVAVEKIENGEVVDRQEKEVG